MEKSVELVFVPPPWITHLVPFMEFAKLLIGRDHRIVITVLATKPMYLVREVREYIKLVSSSESRIRLLDLPEIDTPPTSFLDIESYTPVVREALAEIVSRRTRAEPESARVVGLVFDVSCVTMIDVGDEFGLPWYIFIPINAAFLNLMLYLPIREIELGPEISESGPELTIPGFANSVPPLVLPPGLVREDGEYEAFLKIARRFRDAKGIIINSFSELEPYAFECFSDVEFQKRNRNPPVYGVGPAIDLEALAYPITDRASHAKLIGWLDDQPPASVVYLCFGSKGDFGVPQMREIALALERSEYRFLWTIREPVTGVLPEGFMERIGKRGLISNWAPQADVLSHKAIGGFVSHLGWNSVLESLWNQVPIATWPMRAEQELNAFLMVKELGGLAVEMRLGFRKGDNLVPAGEIENAVRRLMDGDGVVKNKVKEMGIIARKALMDGGSSFASIKQLIDDMIGKNE